MGHHIGDESVSLEWSQICNDLIARVISLYPKNFIGVCQLPQSPGVPPKNSIGELERCVQDGLRRLQPQSRPIRRLFQRAAADRQVVVSILREDGRARRAGDDPRQRLLQSGAAHAPARITQRRHHGVHAVILSDLFKDFPTLKLIIPHGGGAVPFHWGRFRGIALNNKRPELDEIMSNNIFFDTCVYHQPGIDLLTKVVPVDNILFASEMVGAVKGNDPRTGHDFDDTNDTSTTRRASRPRTRTRYSRRMPTGPTRGSRALSPSKRARNARLTPSLGGARRQARPHLALLIALPPRPSMIEDPHGHRSFGLYRRSRQGLGRLGELRQQFSGPATHRQKPLDARLPHG
jgi:4-oxalmesaconate hydratase